VEFHSRNQFCFEFQERYEMKICQASLVHFLFAEWQNESNWIEVTANQSYFSTQNSLGRGMFGFAPGEKFGRYPWKLRNLYPSSFESDISRSAVLPVVLPSERKTKWPIIISERGLFKIQRENFGVDMG